MRNFALAFTLACLVCALVARGEPLQSEPGLAAEASGWTRVKSTIESYLGRPYAWGTAGLKSFDCSGFIWRVWYENGVYIKRTTARKLYFSLPKPEAGAGMAAGNIVFFDNLRHCGIVNDRTSFYHAQTSQGTNLSEMTPFWRSKVVGFRRSPQIK